MRVLLILLLGLSALMLALVRRSRAKAIGCVTRPSHSRRQQILQKRTDRVEPWEPNWVTQGTGCFMTSKLLIP